jgi:hypothetical protein
MKVFAVGVLRWSYFLASKYGTFLLVIRINLVIRNGPSTDVIEKTSFVKTKVDTRVARELSYSALPRTSSGDKNYAKPLNAVIGRVFGLNRPGRTAGSNAKKNDEKVPYLRVVSLALSVRRYVTKRIDQRRGSRAIREATGRRHRASIAANSRPSSSVAAEN